ncbi:MAG TPA: GvpL/GvpF family gas vesicle protein [Terriglobales bacterium]|nr:GvpL/GvpF family gas vesicle protein [Terriglobales bacterium]
MPLLAYCIVESQATIQPPGHGVGGLPVESVEQAGLRCFLSQFVAAQKIEHTGEAALAFHGVVQHLFRQHPVVPFRFPTVLQDETELAGHLSEHAAEYHAALSRLQGLAQVEIRIRSAAASPLEPSHISGTQYLRQRQSLYGELEVASQAIHAAVSPLLKAWKVRSASDHVRCFALVERDKVKEIESSLSAVQISSTVAVRVSGPWPPTEFLKEL